MATKSVKITNWALDETAEGEIVLRGVIDSSSLVNLQTADYQRETLSTKKIAQLKEAIATKGVPDIVLGMRGQHYRESPDGTICYLQDPVFIIDGLQRTTAALQLLAEGVEPKSHLGVMVRFDTTEVSEREMFEHINLGQTNLSPNVTLRNQRTKFTAIEALYWLTSSRGFVLHDQVTWTQSMRRSDLITATTYVKVAAMLHSHAGPGRSSNVMDLVNGIQRIMDNVGRASLTGNTKLFFETIDQCWGVKRVAFRNTAPYLKSTFLMTLARVFSDYKNFWNDDKLTIDAHTLKKLSTFPIDDPEIIRLSSTHGIALEVLYDQFVKHISAGRRTNKLVQRRSLRDKPIYSDDEESTEGGDSE